MIHITFADINFIYIFVSHLPHIRLQKSQASAQQVIGVLNERIDQKDEALKKYQDMLQDLRSEAISTREKHERELLKLSKEHSYKVCALLIS